MSEGVFSGGKTLRAIMAAAFVASAVAGLIVVMLVRYPDELLATASLNYSTIDYTEVNCVSIGPHRVTVEGKDAPDPTLAKYIADILAIRTVLFGAPYSECPWDFSINVAPGPIIAVRYGFYLRNIWFLSQFASEPVTST